MFVGSDWKDTPQWNEFEKQFSPLGVKIVYLPHTDGISSTQLTNYIKKILTKTYQTNKNIGGGYNCGVVFLWGEQLSEMEAVA